MMLSFMERWPKKMGHLAGKPTFFIDKIWRSTGLDTGPTTGFYDFERFRDNYKEKFGKEYDQILTIEPPKIHTIRSYAKNKWKPGMDIDMVINPRTKNRFQFMPTIPCTGIDSIEIVHKIIVHFISNPRISKTIIKTVYVNGLTLDDAGLARLVIDDGFPTIKDFWNFFDTDFSGVIIHWTGEGWSNLKDLI